MATTPYNVLSIDIFFTVENIATLRTYDADNLTVHNQMTILGYYSANDGGGGLFVWDAESTDVENYGTIIVPNSNPTHGRWRRTIDGYESSLNAKYFGVVGNGIVDDTIALQRLIDIERRVYLPAGIYKITSTLVINNSSQVIEGAGRHDTFIAPTFAGIAIDLLAGADPIYYTSLRDFSIRFTVAGASSIGVKCAYSSSGEFKSLLIDADLPGCNLVGFDLVESPVGPMYNTFRDCNINGDRGITGFGIAGYRFTHIDPLQSTANANYIIGGHVANCNYAEWYENGIMNVSDGVVSENIGLHHYRFGAAAVSNNIRAGYYEGTTDSYLCLFEDGSGANVVTAPYNGGTLHAGGLWDSGMIDPASIINTNSVQIDNGTRCYSGNMNLIGAVQLALESPYFTMSTSGTLNGYGDTGVHLSSPSLAFDLAEGANEIVATSPYFSFYEGYPLNIRQKARTTDDTTHDMVFISQAPHGDPGDGYKDSGGFEFNIPAPTIGGIAGDFIVSGAAAVDLGESATTIGSESRIHDGNGNYIPISSLNNEIDVRFYGAVGNGIADDTVALQAAIDAAIAAGGATVRLAPHATYKITQSLIAAKVEIDRYSYVSFSIRGHHRTPNSLSTNAPYITCTALDCPILIIQAALGVTIEGVAFRGPNDIVGGMSAAGFDGLLDDTEFYVSGIRMNDHSPQCAIAIDPFHVAVPAPDQYPGMSSRYIVGQFSTAISITGCAFENCAVGVGVGLHGVGANCENFTFLDCSFMGCRIGYKTLNSQARNVHLINCAFAFGWCFVTSLSENFDEWGCPPLLTNCQAGWVKHIFAITSVAQAVHISKLYAEGFLSIGYLQHGNTSATNPIKFTGCTFSFYKCSERQVDSHIYNFAPVIFSGCAFNTDNALLMVSNWGLNEAGGRVSFDNCSFVSANDTRLLVTANHPNIVSFNDCYQRVETGYGGTWMSGYMGVKRTYLGSYIELFENTPSTISFTATAPGPLDLSIGDPVHTTDDGYRFRPKTNGYLYGSNSLIGIISAINGADIELTLVPESVATDAGATYFLTTCVPVLHAPVEVYGPGVPTSGTWKVGDRSINSAPISGNAYGWECVVAGSPGTWENIGIVDREITPQMFGAVGNGIADDTTAIQSAINVLEAAGSGTVFFPEGTYKITASITIEAPIYIVGSGIGTIIDVSGAHYGFIIGGSTVFHGGGMRDLLIQGTSAGYAGIRIGANTATPSGTSVQFVFERIQVTGFTSTSVSHTVLATSAAAVGGCGVFDPFSVEASFKECYFYGNNIGYFESAGDQCTTLLCLNCSFRENDGYGVVLRSATAYSFIGCIFESNYDAGVFAVSPAAPPNSLTEVNFDKCYWENNNRSDGDYSVVIDDLSGGQPRMIHFRDCTIFYASGKNGISFNNARECTVEHCDGASAGPLVTATNSTSLWIIGGRDDSPTNILDDHCLEIRTDPADGSLWSINGHLKLQLGSGTVRMRPDGTLYASGSLVGTPADTSEHVLGSYTLPGNSLASIGDGIKVTAWIKFLDNTNTKTAKIKLAGVTIATNDITTAPNDKTCKLEATICKHTDVDGLTFSESIVGNLLQSTRTDYFPAITWANDQLIEVTGQSGTGTAGDVYLYQLHIQSINYN